MVTYAYAGMTSPNVLYTLVCSLYFTEEIEHDRLVPHDLPDANTLGSLGEFESIVESSVASASGARMNFLPKFCSGIASG